jgi:HSP90 family molecular chaperone
MDFITIQIEDFIKNYTYFIPYPIYVTDKTDKDKKSRSRFILESKMKRKKRTKRIKNKRKFMKIIGG